MQPGLARANVRGGILVGHQVLGSFVGFKVEWPDVLGKTIGWVMNLSTLLK